MSFQNERISIEGRLQNNWTLCPIKYENVRFDIPTNGNPWIRLNIIDGVSSIVAIGGGLDRRHGIIIISIFTSKNNGTVLAREYADTLSAIYRAKKFDNVTCWSPTIITVGEEEDWYQINVQIPFHIDINY